MSALSKKKNLFILYAFQTEKEITIDFGEHLTGYFSFSVRSTGLAADGPLRFKLTFGEVPSEVAVSFDSYKEGLSRAWLQDEVVSVMYVPQTVTLPRRLAFRYIKSSCWAVLLIMISTYMI